MFKVGDKVLYKNINCFNPLCFCRKWSDDKIILTIKTINYHLGMTLVTDGVNSTYIDIDRLKKVHNFPIKVLGKKVYNGF